MKKKILILTFVMFLLFIASVISETGDVQFGGNASLDMGLYQLYCGYNQTDSSTLQDCSTGQSISELVENPEVKDNKLILNVVNEATCINIDLDSTTTSNWTVDFMASRQAPSATGSVRWGMYSDQNCVTEEIAFGAFQFGDANDDKFVLRATEDNFTSPAILWNVITDTTVLFRVSCDITNDLCNMTVFNATGVAGAGDAQDLVLTEMSSVGYVATSSVATIRSIKAIGREFDFNITEMAIYNMSKGLESVRPVVSIDATSPTFDTASINDSNIEQNEVVALSQEVADETQLNNFMIFHNQSGTFTNQTSVSISGTSFNATFNLTVSLAQGNVIGFGWFANDTSANSVISAVTTFEVAVTDAVVPGFNTTSINNTAPILNEIVALSQEVLDNVALNSYRFSDNRTGDFVNASAVSIFGTLANATFNITVNLSRGNVIAYQWWVDDTNGNANTSEIVLFTVVNIPPESATILFPTADLITNLQPLDINVTSPEDADGDTLTYNYYINGTLLLSSVNNGTFTASDGVYQLNVEVNDGEDSASNVSVTFTLDTTNPIITVTSPLDASTHNTDISVDILCTDFNPFLLNYTFFNSSETIRSRQNDSTDIADALRIIDVINISSLADGIYSMNVSCSDTHTGKEIPDYTPVKDLGNLKLTYNIPQNDDDIGIKLKSTTATLDDYGTYKDVDRYVFWFNFDESESATVYEYVFKIDNKYGLTYINDSDYDAHFATKYNWIDFEFDDNDDAVYTVTQTADNKYEVKILTKKTSLNFESIGGLNIVTEELTLTIDTTIPPVPVIVEPELPLSNLVQIGGMVALLLIILGAIGFTGKAKQ